MDSPKPASGPRPIDGGPRPTDGFPRPTYDSPRPTDGGPRPSGSPRYASQAYPCVPLLRWRSRWTGTEFEPEAGSIDRCPETGWDPSLVSRACLDLQTLK